MTSFDTRVVTPEAIDALNVHSVIRLGDSRVTDFREIMALYRLPVLSDIDSPTRYPSIST